MTARIRREPPVPRFPLGAAEGPRQWWAPCWLELPQPESAPQDHWYFPAVRALRVPAAWFVPVFPGGWGSGDPIAVFMVWVDEGLVVRCPRGRNVQFLVSANVSCGELRFGKQRLHRYLLYTEYLEEGVLALRGV